MKARAERALAGLRDFPGLVGLAASAAGLILTAVGWPAGIILLVGGWLVLAIVNARLLAFALLLTVPLTTFGWPTQIAIIDGRVLDVRLVVTFAVGFVAGLAILIRPLGRITIVEWLVAAFALWQTVSGFIAADSVLTWAPAVARTVAYGTTFALARRQLALLGDLRVAVGVVVVAFGIPTLAGLAQFVTGGAEFLNDATRATSPGGRGPISLAFVGQMTLVAAYGLLQTASTASRRAYAAVAIVVGALGVVASATRLITATAWLSVATFSTVRRQWLAVVLVTIATAAGLAVRGDLVDRFAGTITSRPTPTSSVEPSAPPHTPQQEPRAEDQVADASLRFRFFVWGAVLEEWTERPITGIGPGMTARVVEERSPATRTAPHNDYIGVFAETSVVGLLAFLALQAAILAVLFRRSVDARGTPRSALTVLTAILFISTNVLGALNNPMYFLDIQVAIWALAGGAARASDPRAAQRQTIMGT